MTAWPELVSVALLGTARREPPDAAIASAPDASPEERLLDAAGSLAVYLRAGRPARDAPPMRTPVAGEGTPLCSPSAANRLEILLDERKGLLGEWLRALAACGLRPPPERLPDLLQAATRTRELRAHLTPVLGETGSWLAGQRKDWEWAAPLPLDATERDELWRTGEVTRRAELLAVLRAEDAAEARKLLAATLGKERTLDRTQLIEALATGISPDDEPQLEEWLDHRDVHVRLGAATLLTLLPTSAFADRMRARARSTVARTGRGGKKLAFRIPDDLDAADARDLLDEDHQEFGRRTSWVANLGWLAPLEVWGELGIEILSVVERYAGSDDPDEDLEAAFAQGLEWAVDRRGGPALSQPLEIVRARQRRIGGRAPLSLAASRVALQALFEAGNRPTIALSHAAELLSPEVADEIEKRFDKLDADGPARAAADRIVSTLHFRREMYEELR